MRAKRRSAILLLVALGASLIAGSPPAHADARDEKIIGGRPAADLWRNVVLVETETRDGVYSCTGTLIDATWVMTAAHCVHDGAVYIGGGSPRVSEFTWVDEPIAVHVHPLYDDANIRWDFALYELSAPHPFEEYEVRLADLTAGDAPSWQPGTELLTLGWGVTEYEDYPDDLYEVVLTVQEDRDCYAVSGGFYDPTTSLCGWAEGGSTCLGDSGGPAFASVEGELVQVGITSYGPPGCVRESVFGWVPAARAWIDSVLAGDERIAYRLFGGDRYGTAAMVSSVWDAADVVYVATGANFPDSLAAGPAAAADGAPVLLVQPGSIPEVTARELDRLQPSLIVVLGGTAAVSDAVVQQLRSRATTIRIAGLDRVETSVEVSSVVFPNGSEWVTVASGRGFQDGLIGGAAGANGLAPLLLVDGQRPLEAAVRDEIRRLGATGILVIGDRSGVSDAVFAELAALGEARREGAPDIHARSLGPWSGLDDVDAVLLATSTNFPDALAGAGLAGNLGAPLFLIPGPCVPAEVLAEIDRLTPEHVILLGGPAVVGLSVERLRQC